MSTNLPVGERRGSTRVRLKLEINLKSTEDAFFCEGETHITNLHGALILTVVPLRVGMDVQIHVIVTGTRAAAKVVYVDPDQPRHCGIRLDEPHNIWGVSLPPDDWQEQHQCRA